MAKPTTMSAAKLLILLGDGAQTEVFTAPCGLTTKGINFSKETNDVTVPDCADPDAPAWTERVTRALSSTISGSGVLAAEAQSVWRAFFFSTVSKNCRVKIDVALAQNGGYWQGAYHCTTFNVKGDIGDKIQVEIELQNDGPVTWVAATS